MIRYYVTEGPLVKSAIDAIRDHGTGRPYFLRRTLSSIKRSLTRIVVEDKGGKMSPDRLIPMNRFHNALPRRSKGTTVVSKAVLGGAVRP